jgi:DNA-binding response OmpR family regulator
MSEKQRKILIVDDEPGMLTLLERILKNGGFETISAYDAQDAIEEYERSGDIALAIIDILLPDLSGIEVLRHIRERDKEMPILMVSALNKAGPAVASLQLGASDYIIKPFLPDELMEKVVRAFNIARLKRNMEHEVIKDGEIELDETQRIVNVSGEPVNLTAKEYNLLRLFLKYPNKFISRELIAEQVWNGKLGAGSRTLDAHICSLRRKLGKAGGRLMTIKGEGYKLLKG